MASTTEGTAAINFLLYTRDGHSQGSEFVDSEIWFTRMLVMVPFDRLTAAGFADRAGANLGNVSMSKFTC